MPRPNYDEMEDLRLWSLFDHYKSQVTFYIFRCRAMVKQIRQTNANITLSEDEIADALRLDLLGDDEWMNYLGGKSFLSTPARAVITGYFARLIAFDHYSSIIS